jgi:PAS domain S-box-containing protein
MWVTYSIDALGSLAMLFLAVGIVRASYRMRQRSLVHLYLFVLACALGAFAASRAVGHLIHRLVVTAGYAAQWRTLAPISGGINTTTFVIIAVSSFLYVLFQKIQRERDEQHGVYLTEMQHARDFLHHVIDGLNAELLVVDRAHTIRLVNRKLTDSLGLRREELVGKNCAGLMHGVYTMGSETSATGEMNQVSTWKLVEEHGRPVVFNRRIERRDGGSAVMEVMATPVLNDDGEIDYLIQTLRDITEQVRMEEELRGKEKLQVVAEMAAAVAHELNTPMFTVLGNAQLIQRQMQPAGPFYDELEDIVHEVKRMSRLTRKMTRIQHYTAKDYVGQVRLVDIERASKQEANG